MKTTAFMLLASAGLFVAGCSKPADKAAEQKADAIENHADDVRAAGEAQADAIENTADQMDTRVDGMDTPAEKALDNKADQVRAATEQKADALENKADAVRNPGDK